MEIQKNSMIGYEMSKWLMELVKEIYTAKEILKQFSNLHLIGIWQALMDFNFISHGQFYLLLFTNVFLVKNEQNFKDQHVLFKWTIEDPLEEFYENLSSYFFSMVRTPLTLGKSPCILLLPYSAIQIGIEQFCTLPSSMPFYYSSSEINSLPKMEDWQNAIFLLSTLGPDSLLKVILTKT